MDSVSQINKILGYKTYSDKRKVDALLEMDATNYTNLGTDSTKTEREQVKKNSKLIYKAIKQCDWYLGATLLHAMDSK